MSSILECARAAVLFWDRPTAITMVAIAGGESGWDAKAGGDTPASLEAAGFYSTARLARQWNCPKGTDDGPASWGLWQIFLGANNKLVKFLSDYSDPCWMASWLRVPIHNARTAYNILRQQGFRAWAVYNAGLHEQHINAATAAVDEARYELETMHGLHPIDLGGPPLVEYADPIFIMGTPVSKSTVWVVGAAGLVGGYVLLRKG
jgi:hypothetical protein